MVLRQANFAIHEQTFFQDLIVPVQADPLSILKTIYGYDAFRGEQRIVKSSHLMMIDRPEVVAGAALELVDATRKSGRSR